MMKRLLLLTFTHVPFSQSAGEDCCDASFRRKERDYAHVIPELVSKGITFMPLCFSSYGRLHSEVKEWLEFSSRAAARRRGIVDFRSLLGRTRRNLAVVIQRRLVDQVRACLPHSEVELESIFRDLDHAANESGDPYPGSGRLNTLTSS